MKLLICAVKDNVVGTFMNPFYQHNEAEALRSFKFDIERNADKIANVKDLSLYTIGSFDDETGELVAQCEMLANAGQFVKPKTEEE